MAGAPNYSIGFLYTLSYNLHESSWVDMISWIVMLTIFFVAVRTPKILDFKTNFCFYSAYHQDTRNQDVHFFGVWPIVWTALGLLSYSHSFTGSTSGLSSYINCSFVAALFYMCYYATISFRPIKVTDGPTTKTFKAVPLPGILAISLIFLGWLLVNVFREAHPSKAWAVYLIGQVLCWCLQLWGHAIFEGQAPALTHNLAQAFIMAPEFVVIEILFRLGWNNELKEGMEEYVKAIPLPAKHYEYKTGWCEFCFGVTFTVVGLMWLLTGATIALGALLATQISSHPALTAAFPLLVFVCFILTAVLGAYSISRVQGTPEDEGYVLVHV